ncbi:hypothetical protein Tco_1111341 [Tanacetum coccineum]|uniref:Uncharacterized protein n=1 Tax=Tanacetum coccineum TaxID=301880 RepID=A0ABQ5INU6_9ASTR
MFEAEARSEHAAIGSAPCVLSTVVDKDSKKPQARGARIAKSLPGSPRVVLLYLLLSWRLRNLFLLDEEEGLLSPPLDDIAFFNPHSMSLDIFEILTITSNDAGQPPSHRLSDDHSIAPPSSSSRLSGYIEDDHEPHYPKSPVSSALNEWVTTSQH